MMKRIALKFLWWLIELIEGNKVLDRSAEYCVKEVAIKFPKGESGEFRKNQALRMMMNLYPKEKERDLSLAIERAVHRTLPRW